MARTGQHSKASRPCLPPGQAAAPQRKRPRVVRSTQRRHKINCSNGFSCFAGTCAYVEGLTISPPAGPASARAFRSGHENRHPASHPAQGLPPAELPDRQRQSRCGAAQDPHPRAVAAEAACQSFGGEARPAQARRRASGAGVHQAQRPPAYGARLHAGRRRNWSSPRLPGRRSSSTPSPIATRTPTRRSRASTCPRASTARSARPRASAASPISSTARTCSPPIRSASSADRDEAPVLLANGNPVERGTLDGGARHYAVWRDPHPKPSYLFALVGGNLSSIASDFTTASGKQVDLRIYVGAGQGRPLRLGHGVPQAGDEVGRGAVRARVRPRCVQHRRRVGLQHGGDGEQGPQHLQRRPGAGLARDRHRLGLPQHRAGHRPRVFPQLDRQPHHLPRLVPALPQGGPHGLPRPGVRCRHALRRRAAHRRGAQSQGAPVPRGCRAAGAPRSAQPLHRDQQLLYGHRLRQGRRAGAHAADAHGARRLPQGHGPLFRAPRRPGRHGGGFRRLLRRRVGARPDPVHDLVRPGRHAGGGLHPQVRRPDRDRRADPDPEPGPDARRAQEEAAAYPRQAGAHRRRRAATWT